MESREGYNQQNPAEQDRHRAAQLRGRACRARGRLRQGGRDTLLAHIREGEGQRRPAGTAQGDAGRESLHQGGGRL